MDITNTTDCLKINFQLHHVYFSLGFSFTQCIWMILNFIICKECDDALLNGRMNLPHCKYFWEQKWFLDAVFHQKFMILEASCNFDWQMIYYYWKQVFSVKPAVSIFHGEHRCFEPPKVQKAYNIMIFDGKQHPRNIWC